MAENQSDVNAEVQLRTWFQKQVLGADGLLREQVNRLTALSTEMETTPLGLELQRVVAARQMLEDAWAALGDAALRMSAALRVADAAAAAVGVFPRSVYLHEAGRGGQRAGAHLAVAVERVRQAESSLADCNVRVKAVVHYFTSGGAVDNEAVDAVIVEALNARAALVGAIGFLTQGVQSTGSACAVLLP